MPLINNEQLLSAPDCTANKQIKIAARKKAHHLAVEGEGKLDQKG